MLKLDIWFPYTICTSLFISFAYPHTVDLSSIVIERGPNQEHLT